MPIRRSLRLGHGPYPIPVRRDCLDTDRALAFARFNAHCGGCLKRIAYPANQTGRYGILRGRTSSRVLSACYA